MHLPQGDFMDFKNAYPDFASIEVHIRRARLERSVAIAQFLADAIVGTAKGLKNMGAIFASIKVAKPVKHVAMP
jgi:hypothetical protein